MQPTQPTLSDSTGIKCEHCEGIFFKQSILLRRFSKILIGAPNDHIEPIPVFRCEQCDEICKDYFPMGMKDIEAMLGLSSEPIPAENKSKLIQM